MDRLDTWLNDQHGWRQGLLIWLQLSIPAVMAGWGWWGILGPGQGFMPIWLLLCCLAGALAFTAAVVLLRRLHPIRDRDEPVFLWRVTVAMLLLCGAFALNTLTDQRAGWRHLHRPVAVVSPLLIAAAVAVALAARSRYRRLRPARAE